MATGFTHPGRGPVRCDAAPLLAAATAGSPVRRRMAEVAVVPDGRDGGDAVFFVASYVDQGGRVVGFGVAACQGDAAGLAEAERVVARWARVLRTRRLLVADVAPQCWGGRRALEAMEAAVVAGPVLVIGRPVTGPAALEDLAGRGVRFVGDLDEVPEGARVLFPAHGVGLAVRAEAAARGLAVIDGTCPLVAAAQADVARYAERGDMVVLIAGDGHAALDTMSGQAGDKVVVVRDTGDVEALEGLDGEALSFAVTPGMAVEDATPVIAALRARYPRLRGHHNDVLCYAASDRAQTVASVAAASDLMLVIGVRGDADCQSIARAAGQAGPVVRIVDQFSDLDPDDLTGASTVGLATALSAPEGLATEVAAVLSGLGPLSVVRRRFSTDGDGGESPEGGFRKDYAVAGPLPAAMDEV